VTVCTQSSWVHLLKTFHPTGESEAPICCVIRGLRYMSTAAPLNALQMDTSNSCNIRVRELLKYLFDPRGVLTATAMPDSIRLILMYFFRQPKCLMHIFSCSMHWFLCRLSRRLHDISGICADQLIEGSGSFFPKAL